MLARGRGGRQEASSIHPEKFMYVRIYTSTLGKENCPGYLCRQKFWYISLRCIGIFAFFLPIIYVESRVFVSLQVAYPSQKFFAYPHLHIPFHHYF